MKIIACQDCKRQWDVSRYHVGQKLRCVCNCIMQVPRQRSYTPETHHCEACGAARPPESIQPCRYCGAVPTRDAAHLSLVCPLCFHRTGKKSRFCSNCGAIIQAGKLDVRTGKLACPRCAGTILMNRKIGELTVDECPACSGMWVATGAFDRIVDQQAKRRDKEFLDRRLDGRPIRAELQQGEVVYLKCPVCGRHMHRRNFARASGVIIDTCKDDGVWLDCDELGKIAAYVASGGLGYSKELMELEEKEKAVSHVPIPAFSQFPEMSTAKPLDGTPLGKVLSVIQSLFG